MRNNIAYGTLAVTLLVGALWMYHSTLGTNFSEYLASAFFAERTTPEAVKETYRAQGLKILIVPGHDNES